MSVPALRQRIGSIRTEPSPPRAAGPPTPWLLGPAPVDHCRCLALRGAGGGSGVQGCRHDGGFGAAARFPHRVPRYMVGTSKDGGPIRPVAPLRVPVSCLPGDAPVPAPATARLPATEPRMRRQVPLQDGLPTASDRRRAFGCRNRAGTISTMRRVHWDVEAAGGARPASAPRTDVDQQREGEHVQEDGPDLAGADRGAAGSCKRDHGADGGDPEAQHPQPHC